MKIKSLSTILLTFFFLFLFLFLFISSCNKVPNYNPKADIDKGYIVAADNKINNIEKLNEFLTKLKEGLKDSITIVQRTKEGDPLYISLEYDGHYITYKRDNSKDTFGKPEKVEYKINKDDFYEREKKYYIRAGNMEYLIFDLDTTN